MTRGMQNVLLLLTVMSFAGCREPDMPKPPVEAEPVAESCSDPCVEETCELTPPSFGVFESGSMWQFFRGSGALTPEELEKLSDQLSAPLPEGGSSTGSVKKGRDGGRDMHYMLLPALLFRAKHLFKQAPWTEEETDLAVALADLLARAFDRPEFRIEQRDDASVKQSLVRITLWFEEACQDNQIFPQMLATADDGPFFGQPMDEAPTASLTEVARTAIPESGGWLIVSRKASPDECLVMQYRDSTERLAWSRRITADAEDVREPIGFSDTPIEHYEGLGFRVNMHATWTYGTERMHVYLDEHAGFRFCFISW